MGDDGEAAFFSLGGIVGDYGAVVDAFGSAAVEADEVVVMVAGDDFEGAAAGEVDLVDDAQPDEEGEVAVDGVETHVGSGLTDVAVDFLRGGEGGAGKEGGDYGPPLGGEFEAFASQEAQEVFHEDSPK